MRLMLVGIMVGLAGPSPDLAAETKELQAAQADANDDPWRGTARLRAAIDALADAAPRVAQDPGLLGLVDIGRLTLARAFLAVGDLAEAEATMDEAIRGAREAPLPASLLGPRLLELHDRRRIALAAAGNGRIVVNCRTACAVFIGERSASRGENVLLLGTYRVWVEAEDPGEGQPWRTSVELGHSDETVILHYPPDVEAPRAAGGPPAAARPPITEARAPAASRRAQGRLLPRWLEITGIVLGTAAAATGGAFVGLDGTCVGGGSASGPDACSRLWQSRTGGYASLAAGAAVLTAAVVTLAVDEARSRRARR